MSDEINAGLGIYGGFNDPASDDGIDWFEHLQKPDLPKTSDPLARFVISRIIELETEPRSEVKAVYDEVGGPMAHRYAKHVRKDCVAFRKIVAAYLAEVDRVREDREQVGVSARGYGIRVALRAIAERWADHREYNERWRLT